MVSVFPWNTRTKKDYSGFFGSSLRLCHLLVVVVSVAFLCVKNVSAQEYEKRIILKHLYNRKVPIIVKVRSSFSLICNQRDKIVGPPPSSVGRAPDSCTGGRGFEPQTGPTISLLPPVPPSRPSLPPLPPSPRQSPRVNKVFTQYGVQYSLYCRVICVSH